MAKDNNVEIIKAPSFGTRVCELETKHRMNEGCAHVRDFPLLLSLLFISYLMHAFVSSLALIYVFK
jgi:peroxiredoxin